MRDAMTEESINPFKLGELWPHPDRLAGITAEDVEPEIAAALELPNVIVSVEAFIRRFCILPDAAYLPLAIWAVTTHVADAFDTFPYIALLSPAKRCGKTRVLEVLELLCAGAWRGTSPTSAALYRMMADSPTLLLDEVEALRGKNVSEMQQAILSVLNAGHRKGATVPRCDGPKNELKHFPVFGPKAFAAIGGLPDTLADRCVCLTMQRKTQSQVVDRFLSKIANADAEPLHVRLVAWAGNQKGIIETTYIQMGDLGFLTDRDADLWMPLFAVCAIGAPERISELKTCALVLTGAKAADDLEDSLPLKLLADLHSIWPTGESKAFTASLLESLKNIADSPWAEFDLSARKLSRHLRHFEVTPRQVRIGELTAKGYLWTELEAAHARYNVNSSETRDTTHVNTGGKDDFARETND